MSKHIAVIEVENFGKHKKAQFDFTEGINVIRGENKAGKTFILRALAACLFNTGYYFNPDDEKDEVRYSDGEGKAAFFRVIVTFSDGTVIERYRSKSTNSYTITDSEVHTEYYEAIGRGFFTPVGEATGLFPVSLDGDSTEVINVKLLSDPRFFLLANSPSRQNTVLTRLVGMDVISEAEKGTRSEARKGRTALTTATDRLEELAAEIKQREDIPQLLENAEAIDSLLQTAKDAQAAAEVGEAQLKIRASRSKELKVLDRKKQIMDEALGVLPGLVSEAQTLTTNWKLVSSAWEQQGKLYKVIASGAATLKGMSQELGLADITLMEVTKLTTMIGAAEALLKRKRVAQHEIDLCNADLTSFAEQIEGSKAERSRELRAAGMCPLCGQSTKELGMA